MYSNDFGGDNSPNTGQTWAQFVAAAGSTQIADIYLDLDGGFTGNQVMDVGSFDVNGTNYAAPEPATFALMGSGLLLAGALTKLRRRKA